MLAKEIATCAVVPLPYLQKILRRLRRAGLIEAKRGYRGGFALARPPEEITLFEIIEAVEPGLLEPRCFFGTDICSETRPCSVHEFWSDLRVRAETFLHETSLATAGASDWPQRVQQIGSHRGRT